MATWKKAKLIALRTPDGLVEVNPGVPLGKLYEVDIDSIREEAFYNTVHQVEHRRPVINAVGGYLFLELIEILTDEVPA